MQLDHVLAYYRFKIETVTDNKMYYINRKFGTAMEVIKGGR